MRFISYRFSKRRGKTGSGGTDRIDKVLFLVAVPVFFILILAQVALMSPGLQNVLNVSSVYEGSALGSKEYFYKEGEVELTLQNSDGEIDLKVLLNGDEVAVFNGKKIRFKAKDGDVIELDGSGAPSGLIVKVSYCDSCFDGSLTGESVIVEGNLVKIGKLKIDPKLFY